MPSTTSPPSSTSKRRKQERLGQPEPHISIIGVDVGGTFTDFVYLSDYGLRVAKIPSTPHDPAAAVLRGLASLDPRCLAAIRHGTTVATNALLERSGAKTAFVTTAGFSDLLGIGRGERLQLYSLMPEARPTLVPPGLEFELRERVNADGLALISPSQDDLAETAQRVAASGAESVAVCLLWSHVNPDHEVALEVALTGAGVAHISRSSYILPVFREYERASTTVVNAYVAPVMERYLVRLGDQAEPRSLHVMGSHGGTLHAAEAGKLAAATILSGPAAGVLGAASVARRCGVSGVISLDMGGTSTDVALIRGKPPLTPWSRVGGLPIHLPSMDIETVGAGGGSVAYIDEGGALRVGPRSAGAVPGPAAYGQGGQEATVTDAHVVLGRLATDRPLAGELRLSYAAAHAAVQQLATKLALGTVATAEAIVGIANAAMERALRRVTVARGEDPADLVLVAFGGAGPLHACELADMLGCAAALVPMAPGALSAFGLVVSRPTALASRSLRRGADRSEIETVFAELEGEARERLREAPDGEAEWMIDLRYKGQSWELTLPWPGHDGLEEALARAHAARFGYHRLGEPIELVTARVRLSGASTEGPIPNARLEPAVISPDTGAASVASVDRPKPADQSRLEATDSQRQRAVTSAEGRHAATLRVLARETLTRSTVVHGPTVITQLDSTTYVAPGWQAEVTLTGELMLTRETRELSGPKPH